MTVGCTPLVDRPTRRLRTPTSPEDADRLLPALARWYLEFLAGRRTLRQVEPLLSPAVAMRIDRQRRTLREQGRAPAAAGPGAVRMVTTQWVTPTRCEATVLVTRGGRTTALAVTLDRTEYSWRVVELCSPEDGLPALRTVVPAY